ncbi:4-amino-4-deoxychorismate lyase [Actinoplanes octamycinicus]|uniref:4-amino-4-deoxychorismate lyase n=1 Tax=Actinoplanes octamycinicus TaxID=135948 RepID=A0A7W7M5G8_9ACTN|nr:aminotransferase class IV [Actinoplanes octamycinicus]MBB4737685.1 4-amino-4-deoxychorismate lyase [Actinoplanes octamycinicus]GIE57989.1 4-amino-4-deoxychorismate lyase [Actinoplanes octamycinicus]
MNEQILVSPADLMGDGVFETLHLRPSGPWLLDQHLDRLARSAALLGLPPPPPVTPPAGQTGVMRIIYTRNLFHVGVTPIPEQVLRERRDGIRVLSAGLGVSAGRQPPWSLSTAKTLSYGTNFAARRWAARHRADDVIWTAIEGQVLEAPTASVVWLAGDELGTVPWEEAGILPGITAAHLLSLAPSVGLRPVQRMITLPELAAADTIWLTSSVRGLAEVVTLDGVNRKRSPWTARFLRLLGF